MAVSPSVLVSHLQALCVGLNSLNVLELQKYIQHYHQDMEGVPEYVNALEDAQKRSKKASNPITEDTLLFITKTPCFQRSLPPWEDEIWEDLPKNDKYWPS